MQVLVLYDDTQIKAWLVGESLESVEEHVINGYPELQAETLKAEVIDAPDEEAFNIELFEIVEGKVQKKHCDFNLVFLNAVHNLLL